MEITTSTEKDILIVFVNGRLDASTSAELEKAFDAWVEDGKKDFILDLEKLEYISSAGLRTILASAKKLKAINGKMVFSSLKETVKNVFEISGFGSIFSIFNTKDEALEEF